jgi:hypothetical protein
MVCKEIIPSYSENHVKFKMFLYAQNANLLIVKTNGTYIHHSSGLLNNWNSVFNVVLKSVPNINKTFALRLLICFRNYRPDDEGIFEVLPNNNQSMAVCTSVNWLQITQLLIYNFIKGY